MLLEVNDLQGPGWKVIDERTWRTGIAAKQPWADRAHAMKSVTAWRSFEQTDSERWIWAQVTPLASDGDAVEALRSLPDRMLANMGAEVHVTSAREVTPPSFRGSAATWAREDCTSSDRGEGVALYLAWVEQSQLSAMAASAFGTPWTWEDLELLATRMSERTAAVLATSPD